MSKRMRNFFRGTQPILKMGRSKFDLSYDHKTSFNVGDIVPVYLQEIYPGDTFKVKTTFVCRTLSPYLRPVMDNLFMDIYYFFVPNRLVWTRWQEFMGENVNGYWAKTTNIPVVPRVMLPYADGQDSAIGYDTVANYFGINIGEGVPVGGEDTPGAVSDLPFRAFALIYNEWFRNENFEAPVYINTGDYAAYNSAVLNKSAWDSTNFHGKVPKANKLTDYFTACLPAPQKGEAVDIPIGNAPVVPISLTDNGSNLALMNDDTKIDAIHWVVNNSGDWVNSSLAGAGLGISSTGAGRRIIDPLFTSSDYDVAPENLWALNNEVIGNINDLRFAFQLQKMLEKDARGGTRYVEYLAEHFGCISPDARLQRPEFLGGKRLPLQIQEVAQTSASSETSPQGQLAAYGATIGDAGYSKGFVEHGFVIGVAVIRQRHTYQQGIDRFWLRKDRYDFYDPVFANIGEQPVYKQELYAESISKAEQENPEIFGYNEAWADLRFRAGKITGVLNSTTDSGFDIWHYGDFYSNKPTLNNSWMKETEDYVDRTLSVPSSTAPNFIVDFYHKNIAARVLPVYSIPGLVDHH